MAGAYIATVTAFLVVNVTFLPKAVVFIGPTLLGTSIAIWAAVRYRRRQRESVTHDARAVMALPHHHLDRSRRIAHP